MTLANWNSPDVYEKALMRLLRDLKIDDVEIDKANDKKASNEPSLSSPRPNLLLKIFQMDDRTHRDEVIFDQTRDPSNVNPNRFSFGLALVNTTESTIAKEIDVQLTIFWEGGYQLQTTPIFRTDYYTNKSWRAEINELTSNQPAVLIFRGSEKERCPFGQPLIWHHFKLELKERVKGSFLVSYQITSAQPETYHQGELKITLL